MANPGSGNANESVGSENGNPGRLSVGSASDGIAKPGSGNANESVGNWNGSPGSESVGSVSDGTANPGSGNDSVGSVKLHALTVRS